MGGGGGHVRVAKGYMVFSMSAAAALIPRTPYPRAFRRGGIGDMAGSIRPIGIGFPADRAYKRREGPDAVAFHIKKIIEPMA